MYLRSLELQGFKSFPDKTELKFNKGITAVVGPNGSGKSNISDAVKWVLGEQSAKEMRAGKMTDVIFNGSNGKVRRKPSQFAQVTINLDNEDHALDFESQIVSVSRKIYRNGDSEYLINGNNVRLKDVSELFMDTGLGKDGYAIIGQEKITDIVKGKSNERRELFEEAAGIAKSRYKKEEAERKLAAAEDNINRLNDILGELEDRIEPLKKQCEKAKKFKELDDEKSKLEISVWSYKLDKQMDEVSKFDERIKILTKQYEDISRELETSDDEIDRLLLESSAKSGLVDKYKQEIRDIEIKNSKAQAEIAVCENDIAYIDRNISQFNERIEQSSSSKYFLQAQLKSQKESLERLELQKLEIQKEIVKNEKYLENLKEESEYSDKVLSQANDAVNNCYLEKSAISFQIENFRKSIFDLQKNISYQEENIAELEKNLRFSTNELEKLIKKKEKADEKKLESRNRLEGISKLYNAKKEKFDKISQDYNKLEIDIKDTSNKIKILSDLENSMVGFSGSVKFIINAQKQGRIKGVCGSVAQVINVKAEFSLAVETALGGALQNIITENEDSAKKGIKLLKENNAGRATFLPITSIKGKILEDLHLQNENGFIALGFELVKCERKYQEIINYLLGRICVVENIDFAVEIAKKYGYKFKIVTLDGQIVNVGGSYTGGSSSKQTGILTRKNEIEQLYTELDNLNNNANSIKNKRKILGEEVNRLSAEGEGLQREASQIKEDCIKLEMEIKRANEFMVEYDKKLVDSKKIVKSYVDELEKLNIKLEEFTKDLLEIEGQISQMESRLEKSQNIKGEIKDKREELSNKLASLRINLAEISKDVESCNLSIEQLNGNIENSDLDCNNIRLEIEKLKKDAENKRKRIILIKEETGNSSKEINKLEKLIKISQQEYLRLSEEASKIRQKQSSKINEKENLTKQISHDEERRNGVLGEFDRLVGQLWDEYQLTRSDAAQKSMQIDDLLQANRRLTQLRGDIKSLGSVNLEAIDEFSQVSQRYEFMTAQLNDVNNSRIELIRLIDDLTENMKSEFLQNFDRINKNFEQIFTELFGGGKAELLLTDSTNVLECGIEINVQPPGKVITTMESLSGGEKGLVSIAIYFAILKNSPSPFCMLDEIEAAFDDVNVGRFAKYLHRLTDTTQFITITHRRGTMEEADVLYGVTMQENGISKLLKMNVQQAQQIQLQA